MAFLGSGVGLSEVLLILAVALVLLGPRELPRIARTLGRMMASFRSAAQEFQDQLMNADSEPTENPSTLEDKPPEKPPAPDREDKPHDLAG